MYAALSILLLVSALAESEIRYPKRIQDFNSLIRDNRYVLTLFRKGIEVCPECDRVATELTDVYNFIDSQEVVLASVNCTTSQELCEMFDVPYNYPCLKFFDSTTVIDYYGNYDRDAIVSSIHRLSGPILTELRTLSEFQDFTARYNDSMIMFSKPESQSPLADFASAATRLRANVTFAYASMDMLEELDIEIKNDMSTVVMFYTILRPNPVQYSDELSDTNLEQFITEERFPSFGEITPETYPVYFDRGLPLVWCFLAADDNKPHYLNLLKSVASKSRSQLSWVWLQAEKHSRHAVNFDLDFNWPAIVVDDVVSRKKYIYPPREPFEERNISEWIVKVLANEVQANIKSERPFPDTSDPLIRAVGENFSRIISDVSKNVFVSITSNSWCGACKVVNPQIQTLAEIVKGQPSIMIVEIDGSMNDIPLEFNEFPSMFFYPAGERSSPRSYREPYTYEAMANFILKNSQGLSQDQLHAIQNRIAYFVHHSMQPQTSRTGEKAIPERDEL